MMENVIQTKRRIKSCVNVKGEMSMCKNPITHHVCEDDYV